MSLEVMFLQNRRCDLDSQNLTNKRRRFEFLRDIQNVLKMLPNKLSEIVFRKPHGLGTLRKDIFLLQQEPH
jgi:hypothetical protein